MSDTVVVRSGNVEVNYEILRAEVDGEYAYYWVAGNGNFEEDEYYISLEAAESAVESYFN